MKDFKRLLAKFSSEKKNQAVDEHSPKRECPLYGNKDISVDFTAKNVAPAAFVEYVTKCEHTPHARLEGSVVESKKRARDSAQKELARGEHNRDRVRDKLRTKLRSFDRHKKEQIQYQSAMDWVVAQKGLLFDVLMFATSAMMSKSVKVVVPFALSLLTHHVPANVVMESQAYIREFGSELILQSDDDVESASGLDDSSLNSWYSKFKDSSNWQGIKQLYVSLVCLILHGPEKCRQRDIKKLADENILQRFENTSNVVFNIIQLTKSLFTNFFQCVSSGQWSEFFHSETTYEKWFNDNLDVEREFSRVEIPNNAHELVEKTEKLLKQGKEMIAQLREIKGSRKEILAVNARYLKTYELYTKFVGSFAATQLRRTPFCIFITGKSKIGKSGFMHMNHNIYADLHGKDKNILPYVRQPGDKHWDAFKVNHWSLMFDDVCAFNPNAVVGVDVFHGDSLHVLNTIPKMAESAALEDKGTRPILADLVQVSSNVKDLHAAHYFTDTAAVIRRLQYRVTLTLKDEFKTNDGFLDPIKVPDSDGYADLWWIQIEKAVTVPIEGQKDSEKGSWYTIPGGAKMELWQYLQWFKKASTEHILCEEKFLRSMAKLRATTACQACKLPLANHSARACHQIIAQADEQYEAVDSEGERIPDLISSSDEEDIPSVGVDALPEPPPEPSYRERLHDWIRERIPAPDLSFPHEILLYTMKIFNTLINKKRVQESVWIAYIYHAITLFKDVCIWNAIARSLTRLPALLGLPCAIFFFITGNFLTILQWLDMVPEAHIWENWSTAFQLYLATKVADQAESVRLAGKLVFQSLGGTRKILMIVTALTAGLTALYVMLRTFFTPRETTEQGPTVYHQGALYSDMKHGNEPENVWRMHDYRCSVFDVPNPSSSMKGASEEAIVNYFHRYLVRVSIRWETNNPALRRVTGGTGILIGGQDILLPTHFFDKNDGCTTIFSVTVFYAVRHNVVRTAVCSADRYSVKAFDEEMSILTFPSMPAQRAIQSSIPQREMLNYIGPGLRIGRDRDGNLVVDRIPRIKSTIVKNQVHWSAGEGMGAITKVGDCGAILLALSPSGPVLVGAHMWLTIGETRTSVSYNFCGKQFDSLISAAPPKLDKLEKVGELAPLHSKSPIQYLDDLGGMQVFGSFTGFRTSVSSRVTETIGAPLLKEKYGFVHTHGPPVMKGREVKYLHLCSFRKINAGVPEYQAELACAVFLQRVLKFSDNWTCYIISQKDAVNGVPGVRFIDRIPIATSCGFPYKTPKYKKILPMVEGDWTSELKVDDDIQSDIDFILDRWSEGKRACPVFTAALKDEPRKFAKIQSKSTRIFYGGPAGLIIAERMIFSWVVRLIQTNPTIFMQAPGMDATGSQWDLMYRWMSKHPKWIAGDMKEYDISMIIQFLRMSYKFIILLGQHLGAEPHHVTMMKAAAEDLVNPLVDYFGDLIMGTGKNPSGHALTVVINGIVNAMYMIWCYIRLHPESNIASRAHSLRIGEGFFTDVCAMFYGDDNILSVRDGVEWFNHTAISDLLKSVNVTYTMAEKDRESVPYIDASEVTFLKRSFRYESSVDGYVAPLDVESIKKALMLTIPSKVVSLEKAYADCIVSQNDSMWHHGREAFEEFQKILQDLIDHLDLHDYLVKPLNTYDELRARWLLSRESPENDAWLDPDLILQSDNSTEYVECPRCGCCPYVDDLSTDFVPCRLCGACTFDDPWCINCQEDGFCDCGFAYNFHIIVDGEHWFTSIFLACEECDSFRLIRAPLTRVFAEAHGIPWTRRPRP